MMDKILAKVNKDKSTHNGCNKQWHLKQQACSIRLTCYPYRKQITVRCGKKLDSDLTEYLESQRNIVARGDD
jgi:hypothetical protein